MKKYISSFCLTTFILLFICINSSSYGASIRQEISATSTIETIKKEGY